MTIGPVDFIAIEFKSSSFSPEIVASFLELVEQKLVRIIDLVIVVKDKDGQVDAVELDQLDDTTLHVFGPLDEVCHGMATMQDVEMIGEMLENDSRAAILLFENLWAVKIKEAIMREGGQLLMQERIQPEVVQEALEEIAVLPLN